MRVRFTRLVIAVQVVALCLSPLVAILQAPVAASAAPPEGFAAPQIRDVWQRDDGAVASGRVKGTWLWGPGPFYTDYEPFMGLPQGNHLVQYFDKGRLEVNDPSADPKSPWFVTSGLLVQEMVTGKAQVGEGRTVDLGPAKVGVVGDDTNNNPQYADFLLPPKSERTVDLTGKSVGCLYENTSDPRGRVIPPEIDLPLSRYEPASGHNWAGPFWRYATSTFGDRWLQITGYPIAEPCAVITNIGGKRQAVLVQLFERRVLTFNPANAPAWQVEMGNVGRHYYNWRYANRHEAALNSKYNVSMTIGPAPTRLTSVQQTVELTNSTGQPLSRIVMRAVWHNWEGVFTLRSASVNGKDAQTRWLHGVNLEVAPPQPIPPGGKVTLSLQFDLKPRPVGGRTGYDKANDILSLGDALPTVVPWENGGWSYYPYSNLGDLGYYATSNYSVEIKSSGSERLVIGGTGRITASQPQSSWKFSADSVRDVAYVVSPRFTNPLSDAAMTRKVGKTTMLAYFLPEHRADGLRQLDLVAPAFAWYEKQIGPYPFDTYTVAEMGVPLEPTDNYAQEYPMAYFVPTSWLKLGTLVGSWTWYIPFHEVGHQWFYSTVGSNQLTDPWLDEAMTTYICAEYIRLNFPDQYARAWASMSASATTARPVSSGVYSGFTSESQYTATVYDTGVVMLNKVRQAMGDSAFYDALRDYYSTFKLNRATPRDLLLIFQRHTKADLGGIFAQYLGY